MNDIKYDCVIIGGGISGLSFAHYLHQKGKKILIIEKENSIGGQVWSLPAEKHDNYWRELGAHTCYNSYTHLLSIVKDISCTNQILSLGKGSYVTYSEDKIKKMFAEISVIPLLLNGPKIFFSSKKGKTVREYFRNIVGKKNYDKLFTRLFRAVLSQSADEYPAELFLKRRKGRYDDFPRKFTFNKGLSTILRLIVEKDALIIEKSCEVIDIQIDKECDNEPVYKILALNGQSFSASSIAFATDPKTTARLIKDIDSELAELLASVPLFRSDSLNVVVAKEKLSIEAVAGIIPISDDFHSAVSRDLVADARLRSFTFHFEKGEKNDIEKFEIICSVLNISQDDILESTQMAHVLPSLRMEHMDMAEQVDKLQTRKGLHILGNYFYGLSLEDCIHRSFDVSRSL